MLMQGGMAKTTRGGGSSPGKQHMLDRLESSKGARIFVSIILGLGLASLFRLTCKGGQCLVVRGPDPSEVEGKVYRTEDDACYKYSRSQAMCLTTAKDSSLRG